MRRSAYSQLHRPGGACAGLCLLLLGLLLVPADIGAGGQNTAPIPERIRAFQPGELLTYDVSWFKVVKAGTAMLEVKGEQFPDGREVLRFVVTTRTVGLIGRFYPLGDRVESVFDPNTMQSLAYRFEAKRGKKTRRRVVTFDHVGQKAAVSLNKDPPKTVAIPGGVLDSLSALYYLRTRDDYAVDKPIIVEVFDGGKNRSIEIRTLGREQVKTPAGEFEAITITASEGIFMSKGGITVWLSDDSRKVPVRIKSRLAIGSIVFTLREMKGRGDRKQEIGDRIQ